MHALEDDPDEKGRWRRLGGGALFAAGIAGIMIYGANHFEPTRRLIQKVVEITINEAPKDLPPPRTEPPPPPPKREAPQKTKVASANKETAKPKPANGEETVGLDSDSFGDGEGGAAFQVGNTQMGEPPKVASEPKVKAPPAPPAVKKVDPVRVLTSTLPEYPRRARQLGIEGLVVIEVEIDEQGNVTDVRLRQSLHDDLDRISLAAVRDWLYEPARMDGRAIASTRLLRLRYQLEN